MIKNATSLLVVVLLGLSTATFAQNLKNPSFEDWSTDQILAYDTADHWKSNYIYGLAEQSVVESSDAQDGSKSVLLQNSDFGQPGDLRQAIPNVSFDEDAFVGYYKTDLQKNDSALIRVTYQKGTDQVLSTSEMYIKTNTTDWTYFQIKLDKKNGADSIIVYFHSSIEGKDNSFWIDNLGFDNFVSTEGPSNNEATVFPNPAEDVLNIQFGQNEGSANISLIDMTGRVVYQVNNENIDANSHQINTAGFQSGMYLLKTEENGTTSIAQVVIK